MNNSNKILVLGASGMLGNAVLRFFAQKTDYDVHGTLRSQALLGYLQKLAPSANFSVGVDVDNLDSLTRLFANVKPKLVINCVGIVKQLEESSDPLVALPINALLPHRLARLTQVAGARLVHLSTDCVFSGGKGSYSESDAPDAQDLYGRSKLLGEVDYPNAITLRTSIIGHEISGSRSLVDWFLSQNGAVNGFKKAIFSGLPTVEVARIINDYILPNPHVHGLYHLSSDPINKFDLLSLVAEVYGKQVTITPTDSFAIDRSLNSDRFRLATGFKPESWELMVKRMHDFK